MKLGKTGFSMERWQLLFCKFCNVVLTVKNCLLVFILVFIYLFMYLFIYFFEYMETAKIMSF